MRGRIMQKHSINMSHIFPFNPNKAIFLLADAEARIIRAMFAADVNSLPSGLAAKLKVFLEQHIGLRAY